MTEQDKPQPSESPEPQTTAYAPGPEESTPSIETSHEARNMAMLCHIFGATLFFGPLIIWLSEREKHRFVDEHGRAAINYQISLLIYYAACSILAIVVIGAILACLLTIAHVVMIVMGALKAKRGEPWRYPIAIDFLK